MELNLARDVKDNKKSFCKYIGDNRKPKENVSLLLKVTHCIEEAEVWSTFFVSVFTSNLQES